LFERFTERARQVVVLAQDEARALKHNYIGTEHILLGLLREEEGLAARVLESLDITVEEVRAQVARIVGQGDEVTTGQIPFTPRAKKVLELALREALSLGHNYIGTEHILLGLVGGAGAAYLRSRRLDPTIPVSGGGVDPDLELRLEKRVDEVTKRELALARHAGVLAKREAELEERRGQLDQLESRLAKRDAYLGATKKRLAERAGSIAASERELAARAAAPPPSPPEPAPAVVAPPPMVARAGSWNVIELQRTVDSQSGATVEEAEEWRNYLYLLREHAAADGSLPPQFDGLIEDVFGRLTR
jgi:hypothetical protein